MSGLTSFLEKVGKDAELEAEFEQDPKGVMDRFGLSEDEREAIRSGDLDRIRSASGLDNLSVTNKTIKSYD